MLQDLAPTLNKAAGYDFADFSKPALGLWMVGDKVYGVPFSTSPFVIFYNKDMFDKAGLDRPDWRSPPRASGPWRSSRRWPRS